MKKIENIIDNCKDCKLCQQYEFPRTGAPVAFICKQAKRLILLDQPPERIEFPEWCPLETYAAAQATDTAVNPFTIILPGMPHLEWMTENLSGFGGTEVDGRWYYTYDEAVEAVKQLGNGWRLPTPQEFKQLCDLGSTWDDERKGRWFGGNHDGNHKGSLFFPAAGLRSYATGDLAGVGTSVNAWASSSGASGTVYAGALSSLQSDVNPLHAHWRAWGVPVRCVRNVK